MTDVAHRATDRYATRGDLVLVLNCGSSSIKFALFDAGQDPLPHTPVWNGKVQGIGGPAPTYGETGSAPHAIELDAQHPNTAALALILGVPMGVYAARTASCTAETATSRRPKSTPASSPTCAR